MWEVRDVSGGNVNWGRTAVRPLPEISSSYAVASVNLILHFVKKQLNGSLMTRDKFL